MSEKKKSRGIVLTGWLIFMFSANLFSVLLYLIMYNSINEYFPRFSRPLYLLYILMLVLNIILVVFLFRWRKWPLYVFTAEAVIAFVLNLYIVLNILSSLYGLFSPVLLYVVMLTRWDQFK